MRVVRLLSFYPILFISLKEDLRVSISNGDKLISYYTQNRGIFLNSKWMNEKLVESAY